MKKYSLCVFVILLLLFSGCSPRQIKGKKADISSFFDNISTSFSAQFGELETQGLFTFTPERLTLEFTKPETLSGLKIQVDSQSVTLSINDLSVTKQNSRITEQFNAFAVFSALNCARLSDTVNKTDGKTVISGDGFEVFIDSENRVNEIKIPEKNIFIKLEW